MFDSSYDFKFLGADTKDGVPRWRYAWKEVEDGNTYILKFMVENNDPTQWQGGWYMYAPRPGDDPSIKTTACNLNDTSVIIDQNLFYGTIKAATIHFIENNTDYTTIQCGPINIEEHHAYHSQLVESFVADRPEFTCRILKNTIYISK